MQRTRASDIEVLYRIWTGMCWSWAWSPDELKEVFGKYKDDDVLPVSGVLVAGQVAGPGDEDEAEEEDEDKDG